MPLRRYLFHCTDRPRQSHRLPLRGLSNFLRCPLQSRCPHSRWKRQNDRTAQALRQNRRQRQPPCPRLLWWVRYKPLRHRARHPQSPRPGPGLRQRTRPARTHHPNMGQLSHAVVENAARCAASSNGGDKSVGLSDIYAYRRRIYCFMCYLKYSKFTLH